MFEVKKIRGDFPILKRKINGLPLVYLDNAATSQKPRQVIEAIVDYYENHNANIHRGVHTLSDEATMIVDNVREKVAMFIRARSVKEIVFVRNATEGINLVMRSFGEKEIEKGDAIVISITEHHSNLVTWQMLAEKTGAELRVVDINSNGEISMIDLENKLDKKVKLVAITAVSNVLGTVNDLKGVVDLVRKKTVRAKILVDGSQLIPHRKINVDRLGVDFLVFSGHKMLGPTGTGVLWGRREVLEEMPPFLFGGDMISEVKLSGTTWNDLPYKFEAGTPDIAGIVGLGAAVDYLLTIGMEEVEEYERDLTVYALEKFGNLEKEGVIEIYGSKNVKEIMSIICFNVVGVHAHDSAQILDRFGIAVRSGQHCAGPLLERLGVVATVRASFYIYNTKEEIDYVVKKIPEVQKIFKI